MYNFGQLRKEEMEAWVFTAELMFACCSLEFELYTEGCSYYYSL